MLKRGVADADLLEARLRNFSDPLAPGSGYAAKSASAGSANCGLATALSDFELLTIEDTIIADGREIRDG